MSDPILTRYKNAMNLIEQAKGHEDHEKVKEIYNGWIEDIENIGKNFPGVKERYERIKAMQASFTKEQIDFICYEIGDWYLDWKHRITTGDGHGHRLGYAKEQLKSLICGD